MPPRGVKPGSKGAREPEAIKASERERGVSIDRAEEIAARTVNTERSEAGETSRGGRKKREARRRARKKSSGGRKTQRRIERSRRRARAAEPAKPAARARRAAGSRKSSAARKTSASRKSSARGGGSRVAKAQRGLVPQEQPVHGAAALAAPRAVVAPACRPLAPCRHWRRVPAVAPVLPVPPQAPFARRVGGASPRSREEEEMTGAGDELMTGGEDMGEEEPSSVTRISTRNPDSSTVMRGTGTPTGPATRRARRRSRCRSAGVGGPPAGRTCRRRGR